MPWWDVYFYNSGKIKAETNSGNKRNNKIDASRLSKIAAENKRDLMLFSDSLSDFLKLP
jgi:hypothetical protein